MNAPSFRKNSSKSRRECGKWILWILLVVPVHSLAAPADFFEKSVRPTQFSAPAAISLEQAANKVRRETGGRVLSASPTEKGGRRGYSVRVLLDGKRVKQVFVDAQPASSRR